MCCQLGTILPPCPLARWNSEYLLEALYEPACFSDQLFFLLKNPYEELCEAAPVASLRVVLVFSTDRSISRPYPASPSLR